MLGKYSSTHVILLCLFVAVISLYLRNLVYQDHLTPVGGMVERGRTLSGPLLLAYHERPPYYMTTPDNTLAGLVGTVAYTALLESSLPFTLQEMPPQRQLDLLENNLEHLCAVGWFKNPTRERFARFTLPLFQDMPIAVIIRPATRLPASDITLQAMLGRPDLTLLLRSSYYYGKDIDEAIKSNSPSAIVTDGDTGRMLEMLDAGRGDYFLATTEEARAAISAHAAPERFRLLHPPDVPKGDMRYLMCSLLVTDEEIALLNKGISAARRLLDAGEPTPQ